MFTSRQGSNLWWNLRGWALCVWIKQRGSIQTWGLWASRRGLNWPIFTVQSSTASRRSVHAIRENWRYRWKKTRIIGGEGSESNCNYSTLYDITDALVEFGLWSDNEIVWIKLLLHHSYSHYHLTRPGYSNCELINLTFGYSAQNIWLRN